MTDTPKNTFNVEEIINVAKRQKQILWMILISIIAQFTPMPVSIALLVFLGVMAIRVYLVYALAKAVKSSGAWLYILLSIFPIISLFSMLILNGKATKILQANQIKVGLMGAKSADLGKLNSMDTVENTES